MVESVITVPAAAAARAVAGSPSGWAIFWNAVGDTSNGIDTGVPSTVVSRVAALARTPDRLAGEPVEVGKGDVISGEGLDDALDGCDTAYYLVHSMAHGTGPNGAFADLDRRAAENFARAAQGAGVYRLVYLGGLI